MRTFAPIFRKTFLGLALLSIIAAGTALAQISVSLPTLSVSPGSTVTIPVTVGSLTASNIGSYEFNVSCDTTILRFTGVDANGTLSAGLLVISNSSVSPYGPGNIRVTCASATAFVGGGVLVNLTATAQSKLATTAIQLSAVKLYPMGSFTSVATTLTPGSVRVKGVNHAPAITAISAKTIAEAAHLTFTAAATDADGASDTLTFSLKSPPTGATIGNRTGVFDWTPTFGQAGVYPVTVKVTDLDGASDSTVVSITVTKTNRAPTFTTKMPDATIDEGKAYSFTYAATDPDVGTTLTYKLESGPSGASLSSGVFSWTPSFGQAGSYNIVVSVSDGALADTAKAKITVVHVNRPPAFTSKMTDMIISPSQVVTFTYLATDPDPGTAVTYKLESGPAGATLTNGVFSWTAPSTAGVFNVVVSASDGQLADTAKAKITVDRKPTFATIMRDTTINEGTTLTFTFVATDPDAGATLTYALVNAPTGASMTTSGAFTFVVPASPSRTYSIVSVVSDGLLTDTAKATITVNRKPIRRSFSPTLTVLSRNKSQQFLVSAYDPDGSALTFTWKVNSAQVQQSPDSTYTTSFSDPQGTPKSIVCVFSDPAGLKDSVSWNFTITWVAMNDGAVPTEFELGQNYPNPFNPSTTIRFDLPKEGTVTMEIFNVLGVRVRSLVSGVTFNAGTYMISWDGRDDRSQVVPSGIYLYRLSAGDFHAAKRMTLLK